VALAILEQAGRTDRGRQRSANEDALVLSPPFFAVADGMGGAKAGEVASSLAAESFQEQPVDDVPPERWLERVARDANRKIHELASRDASRRGMGTTLTAAMVQGDEVGIGHVGDSRAYRLRDGQLEQLTRDHSLVAELERSGQISPEAAEQHPQRSIITRALGPEPDVEVDTYTVRAREGDVFLICSDGLTSMVSDDDVAAILRGSPSLEEAADGLVRAANQSGGKDNITVVLFRIGEGDEVVAGDGVSDETLTRGITADQIRSGAAVKSPAPPAPGPLGPAPTRAPRRAPRIAWRRVAGALAVVAVLAAVAGGLYAASRQVYFLGTDDAGLVTLYRGLPYDLPLGVHLYSRKYTSAVPARAVPAARRKRVLDHEWRGHDDAVDLVRQLEEGRLDAGTRSAR
jgi:PPM family protein phosphatase